MSCTTFMFCKVSVRVWHNKLIVVNYTFEIPNIGGGHTLGFVALTMNHSMNLPKAQFGLLIIYSVFVLYCIV